MRATATVPEKVIVAGSPWGLLFATLCGLAGLVIFFTTSEPSAEEVARECQLVAEVARDLELTPVWPRIGEERRGDTAFDCRSVLLEADVPIGETPAREAGGLQVRRGVHFSRPRIVSPDRAIVDVALICGSLCGNGHTLIVERRAGRWIVVGRSASWIA